MPIPCSRSFLMIIMIIITIITILIQKCFLGLCSEWFYVMCSITHIDLQTYICTNVVTFWSKLLWSCSSALMLQYIWSHQYRSFDSKQFLRKRPNFHTRYFREIERLGLLAPVTMYITSFWNRTPRCLLEIHRCFCKTVLPPPFTPTALSSHGHTGPTFRPSSQ
jgi:hypothetical protein